MTIWLPTLVDLAIEQDAVRYCVETARRGPPCTWPGDALSWRRFCLQQARKHKLKAVTIRTELRSIEAAPGEDE